MKKIVTVLTGLLLGLLVAAPAQAHFSEVDHEHPYFPEITITSPTPNSTVSNIFTIRGTAEPNCALDTTVFAQDNQTGGPIESVPQRSGSNFSYTVDTSKVLTRDGLDPYTLKEGKIAVTVYMNFDDPDCAATDSDAGYAEIILNLEYPGAPPAPKAVKKNLEVPSQIAKTPSPSPSPKVAPVQNPAVVQSGSFQLDPTWWIAIAFVAGGLLTGLAEYTVIRYRQNHPKAKI